MARNEKRGKLVSKILVNLGIVLAILFIGTTVSFQVLGPFPKELHNLDVLFLCIYVYAMITRRLFIAKLMASLFLVTAIIDTIVLPMNVVAYIIFGIILIPIWLGVYGLSQIVERDIKASRRTLVKLDFDSDANIKIGIIAAACLLSYQLVNYFHVTVFFLLIYIFALVKKYLFLTKVMFFFWLLSYLVTIGRSFSDLSTFGKALVDNSPAIFFVAVYSVFLLLGIKGLSYVVKDELDNKQFTPIGDEATPQ